MDSFLAGRGADLFGQLMQGRTAGVALVAADGAFLRVNPALCEFLGRTSEQLRECTWQQLTHPDDVATDLGLMREVMAGQRDEYRLRKRYLRPSGAVRWGDLSVSCLRDDDGSVLCFISQILDVTELVETQQRLQASEQRYRLVVEHSSDVVVVNSADGTIRWVSSNVEQLTGYTSEELIGCSAFTRLVPADELERLQQRLVRAMQRQEVTRTVFPLRRKDGSTVWVEAAGQSVADGDDVPVRVVRWRNVDAQHRALQQLRDSELLFRTAMAASAVGMATLSLDRQFTRVNKALCVMVQRDEDWLVAHGIADLVDAADDARDRAIRAELIASGQDTASVDKRLCSSDGHEIDVRHAIGLLRDDSGEPMGYVSQFMDMTEINQARRAMEYLVAHDPLTRVRNRRGIDEGLAAMLGHPARTGTELGVLCIDLDGFKALNDVYGHAFGDQLLGEVARRLRSAVRAADLVGRLGGDEFIVVLNGLHTSDDLQLVADKVRRILGQPLDIEGSQVRVTASIGATLASTDQTSDELLKRADAALYQSKRAGGDAVTVA